MKKNTIKYLNNFIIAEIGTNHNKKKSIVKKMIREIAKSNCQCVKYQIYEPYEIVNKKVKVSDYGLEKFYGKISAYQMFSKYLQTPKKWFPDLIEYALKYNIKTAATIHGDNGIKWASKIKPHFIKIASMDHNNFPFIKKVITKLKIPILVSLGMAKYQDIKKLIKILSKHTPGYGIFHCTSLYPPKKSDLRLNNILYLKKKFNIPVGFSDHTLNNQFAIVAKKYGATFFEKHVTLNRKSIGPDHAFALNIKKLQKYIDGIQNTKILNENRNIELKFLDLSKREKIIRQKYLKGLIANKKIKKNSIILKKDILISRPLNDGLEPEYFEKILGKKTKKFIKKDENFSKKNIYL